MCVHEIFKNYISFFLFEKAIKMKVPSVYRFFKKVFINLIMKINQHRKVYLLNRFVVVYITHVVKIKCLTYLTNAFFFIGLLLMTGNHFLHKQYGAKNILCVMNVSFWAIFTKINFTVKFNQNESNKFYEVKC